MPLINRMMKEAETADSEPARQPPRGFTSHSYSWASCTSQPKSIFYVNGTGRLKSQSSQLSGVNAICLYKEMTFSFLFFIIQRPQGLLGRDRSKEL